MQQRLKHLEPVAIYVRSPDYLRFVYEMSSGAQLRQAEFRSLQKRLAAVAGKIENQNEDAKILRKSSTGGKPGRGSSSKTGPVGIRPSQKGGAQKPGKKTTEPNMQAEKRKLAEMRAAVAKQVICQHTFWGSS